MAHPLPFAIAIYNSAWPCHDLFFNHRYYAHAIIAVSSPKYHTCPCRLFPCYCHWKKGDQSTRCRAPEIADQVLASSLRICELLVFRLQLYVPNPLYCNSTNTWFPLFIPEKMKANLTWQGIADKYTFTRPVSVPKILNTSMASRSPSVTPPTLRSHMGSRIRLPVADLFPIVIKDMLRCRLGSG